MITYLLIWAFFAAIVGAIAHDEAMGFWGGFLYSFFFSPIIGFIIVLFSKTKAQKDYEIQMYYSQQAAMLQQRHQQSAPVAGISIADELTKLKGQLDQGIITEEEFKTLKAKMIA